ncbi:MAG: cytochrome c oxidase assembly factor Coa1 family protein [Terriglobales bacterium]|jgi:hypothetical protein
MESIMLVLVLGTVFILLGRWLYRNPTRLYPGWGIFNPENPGVKKVARAYGTFVIFFGTLAISAVLLRGPYVVLLAIPIAIAGAWFLRPRLPETTSEVVGPFADSPGEGERKQRLLNAHWKRNLPIILGVAVLFAIAIIGMIGNSEVCKLAFARAEASPEVRQRLGEPVKRGFLMSGSIETSGPSGRADISIPISRPRGKATLYAVARKSAGLWKFDTLQVTFDKGTERVDLLKPMEANQLPMRENP